MIDRGRFLFGVGQYSHRFPHDPFRFDAVHDQRPCYIVVKIQVERIGFVFILRIKITNNIHNERIRPKYYFFYINPSYNTDVIDHVLHVSQRGVLFVVRKKPCAFAAQYHHFVFGENDTG